jgi:hypothetical protein
MTPAQRDRFHLSRKLDQASARTRVDLVERMTHDIRLDDASFRHHALGGAQAALAVLEIYQRQTRA